MMRNRVLVSVAQVLIFVLTSCTSKMAPPTREESIDRSIEVSKEEPEKETVEKVQAVEPIISDVKRKLDLAKSLEKSGTDLEVLRLYGAALSSASVEEMETVRTALNRFLSTLESSKLQEFLLSEEELLPRAEMIYRLGLNQAAEGKTQLAMDNFIEFLALYPDHPDAEKVREISLSLNGNLFNKSKVGCMLPLSGTFKMFGERALKGVELAVQDLSREYNQNIKVIIKDTRSDDKRAVICVDELVSENVAGIAGPIITAEAAAVQAEKHKIPMIALTQKTQVAKTGAHVFSNFLTPEMQTQALVSYATRVVGVTKFAVLYPDDKYGVTHMNLFRDKVHESGAQIVGVESYPGDMTDFSASIKKLARLFYLTSDKKNPGADVTAIFIPDAPSKLGMILPQLAYHDLTKAYQLGTNIWHDQLLMENAGKYLNNTVITEGFFANGSNPEAGEFAKRFYLLHGEDPGFVEAVAYDTITMLVRTAMEEGIDSRSSLREALSAKRIFEGVTGRTLFDSDGNAQKELLFLTVKNGEFVELTHSQGIPGL